MPSRNCRAGSGRWASRRNSTRRGICAAVYSGTDADAPRLFIGSHLDTVPKAGAFDGVLGVVLGVALIEALDGKRLPFGIEVLGFSEEEGVRFGTPFIGSRALVGRLDEELLGREDANGISVWQAIEDFGLDPRQIPGAAVKSDVLGYRRVSHRAGAGAR